MRLFFLCAIITLVIASFFYLKRPFSYHAHQLVIGTAAGYAPFVSVNAQGEYEGFDIDVARALAAQLNKKLILKDLGSMSSLFMALEQGSIDAIIWGLSITQDRLKSVAMIHYQGDQVTAYPLLFWETMPKGVRSLKDMNNATVCVEPGSSQEAVLSKYTNINHVMVEKVDDALLNIRYKKVDAALVEPAIAKKFMAKYPEIKCLEVALGVDEQVQGIGIAIKKSNTALLELIQHAMSILKAQGIIDQASERWNIA